MDTQVRELVDALDGVKSTVIEMVRQIGDDGIAWSPDVEDTNSAAVLVTHMFGSEAATIHEYIGGTLVNRDRDSEFASPLSSVDALVAMIERVGERSRTALALESADSLGRLVRTRDSAALTKSVRDSLLGVLMHQAEHVGHMQLADQLRQAV
jgi:hypothetical protein